MESIWPGLCHTLASIEPALRAFEKAGCHAPSNRTRNRLANGHAGGAHFCFNPKRGERPAVSLALVNGWLSAKSGKKLPLRPFVDAAI